MLEKLITSRHGRIFYKQVINEQKLKVLLSENICSQIPICAGC